MMTFLQGIRHDAWRHLGSPEWVNATDKPDELVTSHWVPAQAPRSVIE
jgi:hypothetical protein